jgi:2-oxoglutarate ferredoxin oxidoreductase subunit beta
MMSFITGSKFLKQDTLPHMWCQGCGNGVVLSSLLRSFEKLGYTDQDTVIVSGIGCWGKGDDYVTTNALHVTHGRALSFATGIKAAKPNLHVVVLMGDGDGVTIGGNHFIHSARRNIDLTAIVVNNFNYGMTGGQFSATTPSDYITSTTAYGNPERDFNICTLAEAAGANYIGRSTIYHGRLLETLIKEALTKKGFSLIEVFSACPTHFGKNNKMKAPVEMLRWFKQKSLTKDKYEKLSEEEQANSFLVGKLVDKDAPDFNTRYEEIRKKAMQA